MIVFKKISWKNFLSTGNNTTSVELDTNSTTILLGESGSGKSTLLDAIAFALFNKPFRSINKKSMINSINQKECLVEIDFAIGKREYHIKRGMKPDVFEIYCDGELLNQDAASKDYQLYLERQVLKLNYRSFNQIIMLGASNFTPFMLLKPADRRLIIEELLDIQVFSVMNLLLKQRIANIKNLLQDNENEINLLNEKIKVHEKYLLDLEEDNKQKIEESEKSIQTNNEQIQKLEENILGLQQRIKDQYDSIAFEAEVNQQIKELLELESKLETRSRKEKKEITFYKNNDDCPTCKQHIEPDFKESEIEKKSKVLEEIDLGMDKITEKMSKLEERKLSAQSVRNKIVELEAEIGKSQSSIMAIKTFIHKIEREINNLRKPKNKVAEETNVLEGYRNDILRLETKKEELINERNVHDLANALLKDTGVKSRIIKQYLPLINKYTNKYLTDMSFFVSFCMNENFEETIKARGRDDFSYGNFSDGEKQRLDLALLFTWREIARIKNSVNTNLLILDEVGDSYLDHESTENILQLLTSDVFGDLNIIVISHKNTISDKFERVIRFKKERNFSRIV